MTCAKCKQHFCYRCGAKLYAENPYEHFSTKGGPCYGKLFEYERQEDEEEEFDQRPILKTSLTAPTLPPIEIEGNAWADEFGADFGKEKEMTMTFE